VARGEALAWRFASWCNKLYELFIDPMY